MHRSLIVLPDDGGQPFVDAIAAAKQSLRIKIFFSRTRVCWRRSSMRSGAGCRCG
jgi:hypothetical protein